MFANRFVLDTCLEIEVVSKRFRSRIKAYLLYGYDIAIFLENR